MTLTTEQGDSSSPNYNLTVQAMNVNSVGKVNTVVSKLVINWRILMRAECNINLFTQLLRKNVSTRDVYFLVKSQASLRKIHKGLDKPLSRNAMHYKLNDACSFVNRHRRVVTRLKQDLLKANNFKRFKQKKIIRQVKAKIETERGVIKPY